MTLLFFNRVVAVNSVTSFLLFMGKLLVVGIVGGCTVMNDWSTGLPHRQFLCGFLVVGI